MTPELRAALQQGDAAKALSLIRALPAEARREFLIAAHEANLLGMLGRHEEELAALSRLIEAEPRHAGLHLSVANAFKTLGRRDEAIAAARSALALRPGYGKPWWVIADLKNYSFADAEIEAMQSALANAEADADRLHLHFALGRAQEQRGAAEQAFAHYAKGNALATAALPPHAPRRGEPVEGAMGTFTPDFFAARAGFGDDSNAPIFVLGLHRSGSTLVEQILASHPEIEATGELPIIGQLVRSVAADRSLAGDTGLEKVAALDKAGAASLGEEYLARAAAYRPGSKPRFVDKMPANWRHIGFIRLILPNAVIVDARRHPMATGFSNFRQHYDAGALWSHSLPAIGNYYRDYLRLVRHFDAVLPGKIHHVINERLIDDFEPEVRRLLDHVGVPFDPACLDFHRSDRPVRSASAEQVRRPVNREGVDQWRKFEPWLGPLKEALGPALEDWQQ